MLLLWEYRLSTHACFPSSTPSNPIFFFFSFIYIYIYISYSSAATNTPRLRITETPWRVREPLAGTGALALGPPAEVVAFPRDPPVVDGAGALEDVAFVEDAAADVDDPTPLEGEPVAGVEPVVGAEGTLVVDSGSLIPQTASASKVPKGLFHATQSLDARLMASVTLSAKTLLG